jgi:predicted nucleotidyltransferase
LKLEGVLRETLKPLRDRVWLAFVFGSTARRRQGPQSDIDLMVIGDVTLKDLSTPLRDAERTLGRRINPALYSREAFRERYQAGDPFLTDVYRREKIAIIPGQSPTAEKDLENELGGVVARVLASGS